MLHDFGFRALLTILSTARETANNSSYFLQSVPHWENALRATGLSTLHLSCGSVKFFSLARKKTRRKGRKKKRERERRSRIVSIFFFLHLFSLDASAFLPRTDRWTPTQLELWRAGKTNITVIYMAGINSPLWVNRGHLVKKESRRHVHSPQWRTKTKQQTKFLGTWCLLNRQDDYRRDSPTAGPSFVLYKAIAWNK